MRSSGTRSWPEKAALKLVAKVCRCCSGGGDHDAVDQDARHLHLLGRQRAGGRQPLDLGDDEALARLGRHRDRQVVEDQRLALHADIAVGVGGGAADDRDVDRDRLVEQPLPAVDLHHPDEIGCADQVQLAAAQARDRRRCRCRPG